jgi:anaerobic ribonucleoside-triphosphate reductase activating protein
MAALRVAYIKTSLLDFPGRLASVLFLPVCNFRCPYCHNAALVETARLGRGEDEPCDDALVDYAEFLSFLDARKSLISGVAISGGEPLLRDELPRIIADIRDRGLAVKLDTNGSRPDRLAALLAPGGTGGAGTAVIDYAALDLKTSPSSYASLAPGLPDSGERVLESLSILREARSRRDCGFEIRITCVPGIVGRLELEDMGSYLEAEDEVILQEFRPGGCLDPTFDEIEPYTKAEMEELLAIARRRAPGARVRGWR